MYEEEKEEEKVRGDDTLFPAAEVAADAASNCRRRVLPSAKHPSLPTMATTTTREPLAAAASPVDASVPLFSPAPESLRLLT
jgi:hypothetical protein